MIAVTLACELVVAVASREPRPRGADRPGHAHAHGAALLAAVGSYADLDRSIQRLERNAARRDPSGRAGSGGRVVVHRADARNPRQGSAHALLHRTGYLGLEPTLGVLADGTLFVQAVRRDAVGAGRTKITPAVLSSRDDGRTFHDVSPTISGRPAHQTTQDPYLYAEPRTGRVFTTDYAGCALLSHSGDGGEGWTSESPICGGITDHQTLFGGPPATSNPVGYPDVLYYCAASVVATNYSTSSACVKSIDGGVTFSATGQLAYQPEPQYDDEGRPDGVCSGLIGHGVVGGDGTVYLPKVCDQPMLLVSRDEGDSWSKVVIPTTVGTATDLYGRPSHEAAVDVDARGVVYYTWMGRNRLPYLTTSRDRGRTWTTPLMVGAPGLNETALPALAVTPGGRVAIAYVGTRHSPGAPFPNDTQCSPTGGRCRLDEREYIDGRVPWSGFITVSDDATASSPTFTSVSVNAYSDPLTVGSCGPFRCQQQYDFIDVQLDRHGTPWAVFSDGCDAELSCEELGEAVVGRITGLRRVW